MVSIVETAERDNWSKTLNAKIVAVLSNRPKAKGLAYAKQKGIATGVVNHTDYPDRSSFEKDLMHAIDQHNPSLLVLAGFMRVLTPLFVSNYAGKILNIHPSLLPAFPGLHTHQRALDTGCKFAGATVHEVIPELDAGKIIDQVVVPIQDSDTAESLAARVLTQEHLLYPRAIKQFLQYR